MRRGATTTALSTSGGHVSDGQLREAGHCHLRARVDQLELVVAPVEHVAQLLVVDLEARELEGVLPPGGGWWWWGRHFE